jgi:hypothetical protein
MYKAASGHSVTKEDAQLLPRVAKSDACCNGLGYSATDRRIYGSCRGGREQRAFLAVIEGCFDAALRT